MRYCIQLFCYFLFFCSGQVYAAMDLELTQGTQGTIPIAIASFAGNNTSSALLDIAAIVRADLRRSGRFQVLDETKSFENPATAQEVNLKNWQAVGVNNLSIGSIKEASDGRYQIKFQLLDVYGGKKGQNQELNTTNTVLVTKEFMAPSQSMRQLAHHISDIIYEKLTGNKGVFSTHIAYVVVEKQNNKPTRYHLEVADYDGYNPRNIFVSPQPIMSPSWSPDGKQIAYVSFEKAHAGIYVQDISSGNRRLLTDYPGINGAPAWSADGKKLALVLSKEGSPNIYTLDVATGNLVQRTTGTNLDTEPSWSPDSNTLIFTSNRSGGPQIYKVDLNSGNISRVTFEGNYNTSGSYTPDGKSIVFLHMEGGVYGIALQNLQSGKMEILTNTGRDQSPSVAPNGNMVLFATRAGGHQVLSMVSTDTHIQSRLPARQGDVREPDWSPL